MKCQICKDEEAVWAWQPFGPDELPNSYTLIGSHYRGFPVIKVGDVCKNAFQTGDFEVQFTYQGHHFVGKDHRVKEVHIGVWEGGKTSTDQLNPSEATMIMKDALDGPELIALVFDTKSYPAPELVQTFLVAPGLLEACRELDTLRDKIAHYLDFSYVSKEDRTAILTALAKVHVSMKVE